MLTGRGGLTDGWGGGEASGIYGSTSYVLPYAPPQPYVPSDSTRDRAGDLPGVHGALERAVDAGEPRAGEAELRRRRALLCRQGKRQRDERDDDGTKELERAHVT